MIKTYFKKACIIAMCISLLLSSTSIVHAKETGWEEKDGRWYYYYADGTTPVGEVTIDGTGYIFTAEGYILDKNETLDLIDSAQSGYGVKPIGPTGSWGTKFKRLVLHGHQRMVSKG